MRNMNYVFTAMFSTLGVLVLNGCTNVAHAQGDKISELIQRVEYQNKKESANLNQFESIVLGYEGWKIECRYQVFDDVKACMMQKGDITVLHLNNGYVVNIGERVRPNSQVAIYVDKNSIQRADDGLFRNANYLINQFKKGNHVFIRYQKEGSSLNTEAKISLLGFTAAFNDMERRFQRLSVSNNSSRNF